MFKTGKNWCSLQMALVIATCLIPAFVRSAENSWSTNGPYGASVLTIAFHPFDHMTMYIGTVESGIWRTSDGGQDWRLVGHEEVNSGMRRLAIHPTGPDSMFAATYAGVYKSTDAGLTWRLLYPPTGVRNDYRALAINPDHPNVVFAGGPMDAWRSTDGGESWYELNRDPPVGIDGFAIDPNNHDVVYFVSGSVVFGLGIWKSLDMGESWLPIQNNIDSTGFGEDMAIDPVDSNVLYFARSHPFDSSAHCLSKSTDGGASWSDVSPLGLVDPSLKVVRVSPHDHNVVFVGTFFDGVYKSVDGGGHWAAMNTGLKELQIGSLELDPIDGNVILGTYYDGIYKSTNGGESWQNISSSITSAVCHDITIGPVESSSVYVAALNGLFRSTAAGESWQYVNVGIPLSDAPGGVAVDWRLPEITYLSTFSMSFMPSASTGVYRSTDNGVSWMFLDNGLPENQSFGQVAISYMDNGARRIFLASTQGVYRSDDIGETWALCQGGLPAVLSYTVVLVAPSNANIVVAGEGYGGLNRVFVSMDRGDTWASAASLPPSHGANINDMGFDPTDENHLYVASSGLGLFETTDLGQNWSDLTSGVPLDPYYQDFPLLSGIAVNPANPANMFVSSCHMGVYQSHDNGHTWESFNVGLDTTVCYGKIVFVPGDTNTLFYATHMRSVWSITRTTSGMSQDGAELPGKMTLSGYPNPFNETTVFDFYIPVSGTVTLSIYDLLGRKVAVLLDTDQSAGAHRQSWKAADLPSGIYFARLQAGGKCQNIKMTLMK